MRPHARAAALYFVVTTCWGEATPGPASHHQSIHELTPHVSHRLTGGYLPPVDLLSLSGISLHQQGTLLFAADVVFQLLIDGENPRMRDMLATAELVYQEAIAKAKTYRKELLQTEPDSSTYFSNPNARVWDLYYPDWNCLLVKERLGGVGDGGKWLCGVRYLLQGRPCVIYSLGSAGDTSFEESIHEKTSCSIHTFDHTLSQELQQSVARTPGLEFHSIGIGRPSEAAGMQTLHNIMADLKHTWIDVLKVDIEGSEWEMFRDFYAEEDATLPVTQILVEFHFPDSKAVVFEVLDKLHADGFRVFATEANYYCGDSCAGLYMEFALIKVSPDGHVCLSYPENANRNAARPQNCFTGNQAGDT